MVRYDYISLGVSYGYGTCFVVKTCDELYHFIVSIDRLGIPFGFQTIIWSFARHPVSRCLTFPAIGVTWSIWTYGSTWVVLWLLFFRSAPSTFPNKRSTLRFRFGESLVVSLYSEIGHIHLGIARVETIHHPI